MNKSYAYQVKESKMMKQLLSVSFLSLLGSLCAVHAQVTIGSSSGSSYTTSTWTNGSANAFSGWFFTPQGNSTTRIADSSQNGRTSIGSQSFFILGGTNNEFIDVFAPLGGNLATNQVISLNANYSWNGGTRGIEFEQAFGAGALFRFVHGGSDELSFGFGTSSAVISTNIFNQAISYRVAHVNDTSVNVSASIFGASTPFFSTNLVVAAMPNQVKFYTGGYAGGADQDNFGLFFNNLTTIPEPSTPILMGLGLAGLLALRRIRKA